MKRLLRPAPIFLLAWVSAAVLAYNLWSYCCGRCRLEHFFTLGPAGMVLLLATGTAAAVLLALRRRHPYRGICKCGTPLATDWSFCPSCGIQADTLH